MDNASQTSKFGWLLHPTAHEQAEENRRKCKIRRKEERSKNSTETRWSMTEAFTINRKKNCEPVNLLEDSRRHPSQKVLWVKDDAQN